jgi:lipoate---protein ligase
MKLFDCTLPSPAANLAADEALLDLCDEQGVEVLRFWESPSVFVVVGYGNRIQTEVNVTGCEANGVPVFRRCSGGGTVVQGPGCLNYAFALRLEGTNELATVTGTNRYFMERNRKALADLLGCDVSVEGHTDLAVNASGKLLKFSGNAQRRRRNAVLFHGTFLWNFDLMLVSKLLNRPSKEPDYRQSREHSAFIANVSATAEQIKNGLRSAWMTDGPLEAPPLRAIESLARDRYSSHEWNRDRV